MREMVAERRPDLLELVTAAVGEDPFERLDEGTAFLQPAIFCTSLALQPALEVDAYAGHSLGDLSALVAAGSLTEEDGMHVVAARGRLMQRASEAGPAGAMLALGANPDVARELAARFGVTHANDNSPDQAVLSGPAEAIARVRAEAKARGLRAIHLPIKGAFHSPGMAAAVPAFRAVLDGVQVRPPRRPVLSSVTAREFDDMPSELARSLTEGVRWREVVLALHARGVRRFVEAGPGRVLTGLVRCILAGQPDVEASTVEIPQAARV